MERPESLLQRELQQSRPFASARQEALLAILKTADVVRRRLARALVSSGITPQQYNVLRVVRGAGSHGIATLAIGGRLIETTPGLTRLLDRLKAKGWVERWRCPGDRRQVLCRITASGDAFMAALDPAMNQHPSFSGALADADAAQLVTLLEKVRAGGVPESSEGDDTYEHEVDDH